MSVAKRIEYSINNASLIRKMFEEGLKRKAELGEENVFDFSLGNPNLEPPAGFKDVLKKLINDPAPGRHGYMPNAGYESTRQAVADFLSRSNRAVFSAGDVVMTVGAGGGLNVILKTLLDPGDEVIIPSPYFMEYNFYLENHQGLPRIVPTARDFSLDLKAMEDAVCERTKAVLINSPNNPTGRVYTKQELAGLGKMLDKCSRKLGRTIYLISDEPYRKLVYEGIEVPGIFEIYSESIMSTSFSKDLSLPGERIGYVAVNPAIREKYTITAGLILSNRILGFVNAPALMQRAIPSLLDESVDISFYQRNRDMLCEPLESFGYEFIKPQGAFYLFPETPVKDDVEFVSMLKDENILTVPGSAFGCPGHFRIAYCTSASVIERSLPGFERAMKKAQGPGLRAQYKS
jgi:aspartate aminotransferase